MQNRTLQTLALTPHPGPSPTPPLPPASAGVHKQGLTRRFFKRPDGTVGFDGPATEWDLSGCVPLECRAGTLVLLHGENVHYRCVRGARRAPANERHATWPPFRGQACGPTVGAVTTPVAPNL